MLQNTVVVHGPLAMNTFMQSGQWTVIAGTSPAAFLAVSLVLAMLIDVSLLGDRLGVD